MKRNQINTRKNWIVDKSTPRQSDHFYGYKSYKPASIIVPEYWLFLNTKSFRKKNNNLDQNY